MQPVSNSEKLIELSKEMLAKRRLIVVSNRGPIEYRIDEDGKFQGRRGSGGVVTGLSALSQYVELTWIASAMGEGDRKAAESTQGGLLKSPVPGMNLYLRFVTSPRSMYHRYYNVFCNPLLWFLQHYMWNSPRTPNINAQTYDAWENGYVPVNEAFSEAVIAEAEGSSPPPFVMLHDYHLYLAAGYIRKKIPNIILQHFTHIPWPAPSYWQLLPMTMRRDICENLCANDIVGLQTIRDVRSFLSTCETFLEDAEVDHQRRTVWVNEHLTTVNAYPISIDVIGLRKFVQTPRVKEYEQKLSPYLGEKNIVRVDRAEPSKNIVRGFRAFDMLLEAHPEYLGKVKLLAFLVPSRTHIRQYQRYAQDIHELIAAINSKYGTKDWEPIKIFFENNYPQAIAGMRFYDALLVNPVIDGMNLVAKEGCVVNAVDGVLILSETAGAYEQLGKQALSVAPADLEGTMQALHQALTMPAEERKSRADALKKSVEEEDVIMWFYRQFDDLMALA